MISTGVSDGHNQDHNVLSYFVNTLSPDLTITEFLIIILMVSMLTLHSLKLLHSMLADDD